MIAASEHVMPEARIQDGWNSRWNMGSPRTEYESIYNEPMWERPHWQPATANEAVMWGCYQLLAARGCRYLTAIDRAYGRWLNSDTPCDWGRDHASDAVRSYWVWCQMTRRKTRPQASVRLKAYAIIADALDAAVVSGYNRAFKHTAAPDSSVIIEAIQIAVIAALCDVLDFSEGGA